MGPAPHLTISNSPAPPSQLVAGESPFHARRSLTSWHSRKRRKASWTTTEASTRSPRKYPASARTTSPPDIASASPETASRWTGRCRRSPTLSSPSTSPTTTTSTACSTAGLAASRARISPSLSRCCESPILVTPEFLAFWF